MTKALRKSGTFNIGPSGPIFLANLSVDICINRSYNRNMTFIEYALIILVLLQVKHWYIDFVNQSADEVKHKGIYLDWLGIKHSLKQGVGTFLVFFIFTMPDVALLIGVLDFLLHYHIDWLKMNYGNRDITTPQFWNHLGLDQMAHQLSYIFFIYILLVL